jgi:hypothetical protein
VAIGAVVAIVVAHKEARDSGGSTVSVEHLEQQLSPDTAAQDSPRILVDDAHPTRAGDVPLPAGLRQNSSFVVDPNDPEAIKALHPMHDPRFESEPIDEVWAPLMEASLRSVVVSIPSGLGAEIREVQCRTTICRVIVRHDLAARSIANDPERSAQYKSYVDQFRLVADPLWRESPRLNGFGSAFEITDSGDLLTVFYVRGPPLVQQ